MLRSLQKMMQNTCLHFGLHRYRPYLADLTLASPPSDNECFGVGNNPGTVVIRFFTDHTPDSCHNIASVFSNGQGGRRNYTCDETSCPGGFLPLDLESYSPKTSYNYTSLAYSEGVSRMGVDHQGFTLKVFPREDCEETEEEPWFSWGGCDDELACKELPYSVASFRLEKTAEEDLDECLLAAEHGAGVRGKGASVGAALLTVVGLMMMFW
jgi:hypothetical protein